MRAVFDIAISIVSTVASLLFFVMSVRSAVRGDYQLSTWQLAMSISFDLKQMAARKRLE